VASTHGRSVCRQNGAGRFTVDVSDYAQLRLAFDKIMIVFEKADAEP
jgi:hypothetical protein